MNFVDPIRDRRKIAQIKTYLDYKQRYRDLLLFTVGINTALRISDLLLLTVGDLYNLACVTPLHRITNADKAVRTSFVIHDTKTSKRNRLPINDSIKDAANKYSADYPTIFTDPSYYLFYQTSGKARNPRLHICANDALYLVKSWCKEVGLPGNYGTHSLRKTWAYQARKAGVSMETIMHKLNHSNFAETKRYIGITDDEIKAVVEGLNL